MSAELVYRGIRAGATTTRRERALVGALLLLMACDPATFAQQLEGFTTYDEAGAFVERYYRQPRPELIGRLIATAPLAALLAQKPNSRPPFVGFISEIFAMNPERLPLWQEIAAKQDPAMKALVASAIALNKAGGVIASNTHSAPDNDMDWGAFFASGQPRFVERLVTELRFVDSTDVHEFWVGASAKWSPASNSQTHPKVRQILDAARLTSDKRTQEILTDLLSKDPALVWPEMKDIARSRWGDGQRPPHSCAGRARLVRARRGWLGRKGSTNARLKSSSRRAARHALRAAWKRKAPRRLAAQCIE